MNDTLSLHQKLSIGHSNAYKINGVRHD